eukprot:CAMPEP_0184857370 /NCGR_PEP_ID=MMETSP0580-20130426/2537_1 /TAXON_ID=1118495 /ORGANISM="Dactyliosolen fragilissimus" /LENGTH=362 /DNA_ID=CAMNT_0027352935 /DNA_START=471 /DNA_END=1559 /DNA_ORIENTATION=+
MKTSLSRDYQSFPMVIVVGILIILVLFLTSFNDLSLINHTFQQSGHGAHNANPYQKDICFIHIGKSSGNTIVEGIKSLMKNGGIGNVVQIHGKHAGIHETYFQTVTTTTSKGELKYTVGHNYDKYKSPIGYSPSALVACASTKHVLLWVRDPITRFISTWNFNEHFKNKEVLQLAREMDLIANNSSNANNVDLNYVLDKLRNTFSNNTKNGILNEKFNSEERGFDKFYHLFKIVDHATTNTNFELQEAVDDNPSNSRTRASMKGSCEQMVNFLPIWFVGRTEHFDEDWKAFEDKTIQKEFAIIPKHMHKTPRQGIELKSANLHFLRKFFAKEYECLQYIASKGWLPNDYIHSISNNYTSYYY